MDTETEPSYGLEREEEDDKENGTLPGMGEAVDRLNYHHSNYEEEDDDDEEEEEEDCVDVKDRPDDEDRVEIISEDLGVSLDEIRDNVPNYVDKTLVKFLLDNFKKRVCRRFVCNANDSRIDHCFCGYPDTHHEDDGEETPLHQRFTWHPLHDTVTFPTDAFGEIYFGGKTNGKYVRVDYKTDLSKLVSLLVKLWNIPKPKLIISVKGAKRNFHFPKKLKQAFCHGLTKAAVSTNAWVITDGRYQGATKEVGEAIRYYGVRFGRKHQIVSIGISPWGCVNNRDILVNQNGYGHWPVHYIVPPDAARMNETQLDRNHSHFILIDDGTQHKSGHEKTLRENLERRISNLDAHTDSESVVTPIVSIILGGDLETLSDIMKDIDNGTSVIIIEGSGGMADILAYAFNNCKFNDVKVTDAFNKIQTRTIVLYQEKTLETVEKMIRNQFNLSDATEYREIVRYCIEQSRLLSTFKAESKSTLGDIDDIILKAILKTNQSKRIDQLRLALALNRVDIAKDEIYTEDAEFEIEELHELLFTALVDDNIDFVRLLIDKGVTLNQFLTVKRLLELYNHPFALKQNSELDKTAKKSDLVSLRHVGKMIFKLMGEYYHPMYLKFPYKDIDPHMYLSVVKKRKRPWPVALIHKIRKNKTVKRSLKKLRPGRYLSRNDDNIVFEDPAKELFLWCILVCRTQMSLIFWERGYNAMAMALMAQHISCGLKSAQMDSDMLGPLEEQEATFEKLAVEVLNECYETDQRRATLLLVSPYEDFDGATLLEMAMQAGNELFISHYIVQKLLTNIWIGNISDENSYIRVLFALALPIFSPYILKYRNINIEELIFNKEEDKDQSDLSQKMIVVSSNNNLLSHNNTFKSGSGTTSIVVDSQDSSGNLKASMPDVLYGGDSERWGCCRSFRDRFVYFFDAPVTKFSYHCVSHFGFLILFGLILLTDFYPEIEWKEMLVMVWVFTLAIEEIRQLVMGSGASWKLKFSNYITDMWNIMDLVTLALFIAGVVLRFVPIPVCHHCFYASRIVLAFSLMMHFLRVLRFFSIHQKLGPLMVMIRKTMIHLAYFFVIVIVFVLAYGVSTQVMLFPNYAIDYRTFKDVILSPWFKLLQQMDEYTIITGEECHRPENSTRDSAEACAADGRPPSECWGREELCPAISWLVPIITAFYMLVTNVMMLNLLIAMISDTFTEVSSKTALVWCMQRYQLIQEYDLRPNFPPPFIIFNHLYLIFRCVTPKKLLPARKLKFCFTMELASLVRRELKLWEVLQAERYMRKVQCDEVETVENKVKDTSNRVDTMSLQISQFTHNSILAPQVTSVDLSFAPCFPPDLDDRFSYIEKHLEMTSKTLFWLINRHTTEVKGIDSASFFNRQQLREHQKVSNRKLIEEQKKVLQQEFQKVVDLHQRSRTFAYGNHSNKKIFRCAVPDSKVPFEVDYPEYKPETFTDDTVYKSAYSDEDITRDPTCELMFNEHRDGHVNRISLVKEYQIFNGVPLNPMGRTGLRGRGVLPRWGPNRVHKAILTRWEDKSTTEGLKRLQFLSVQTPLQSTLSFIPEYLNPHEHMPVYESLYPAITNVLEQKAIVWLRANEKFVNQGYLDDPRNTDNAWLEVVAMNYHDEDKSLTSGGPINPDHGFMFKFSSTEKYSWKRISSNLETFGSDLVILYQVAKMYDAVF